MISTDAMKRIKRVLVVRNDRFGEFLLNIPAMRAIKATYPGVKLCVAVAPAVEGLARSLFFVDQVLIFPADKRGLVDKIRAAFCLYCEKFDAAIILNPTAEAHQIVFLAGIPVRVGYARKYHRLLTHTLEDIKGLGRTHEVLSNLELVSLLGCSTKDLSFSVDIPEAVESGMCKQWDLDRLVPYVVVHPWTSDSVKQWPLENFERLITVLARDASRRVVVIGRPEAWHRKLVLPVSKNIIDMSGQTTLLESAVVLKHSAVLVSCDSGPVHLAASVGGKVIALFRNDMPGKNPERWGPWPVERHVVIQRPGMEEITVEVILNAVKCIF